jgi:hypothetical protein
MDKMNERVVNAKPEGGTYLAILGSILIMLVGVLMVLMVSLFGILVIMVGGYVFAYVKDGLNLEYEYTLTNGDIDVAKILAKNRRKEIASISADSITYMNYADSDRVKNDLDVKKGSVKIRNFSGRAEDGKDVAIYSSDGKGDAISIFNFDDKCLGTYDRRA